MDTVLPPEDEALSKRLEELASVLTRHDLTHLEYQDGQTSIILKREHSNATGSALAAAPLGQSASLALDSAAAGVAHFKESVPAAPTAAQQLSQASNAAASPSETEQEGCVTAPLVGLAYRSKEPGATPFVAVGESVAEGSTLCLIEAMKMFNEVKAPHAGVVESIHFADGELVEYGAPLFTIRP